MKNNEIKLKIRELALEHFGLFFDIPVVINPRLKRTLGRIIYRKTKEGCFPCSMELSPSILNDPLLLEKTILHELSHWYLMVTNQDFHHRSKEFKTLSRKLGFDTHEP
ncbi:SprT-like domain-containing protein [Kosmotoga pacifica]|uniref:SprT-like domain-containing protein n=1 Tax=Kosmotoga pacifica TaxID=1330330 RepID=UPI0012E0185D|nr:SprT-like domain-containing protein [Kosmotoga pacifica]